MPKILFVWILPIHFLNSKWPVNNKLRKVQSLGLNFSRNDFYLCAFSIWIGCMEVIQFWSEYGKDVIWQIIWAQDLGYHNLHVIYRIGVWFDCKPLSNDKWGRTTLKPNDVVGEVSHTLWWKSGFTEMLGVVGLFRGLGVSELSVGWCLNVHCIFL